MSGWLPRFRLRSKLAVLSLLLLTLPWVGYQHVREMEVMLLELQREGIVATSRAVATALHDRPQLMRVRPREVSTALGPSGGLLPTEELLEAAQPLPFPLPLDPIGVAEVEAILRGLERTTSRIQVINRDLRVVALAGTLSHEPEPLSGWRAHVARWLPPLMDERVDVVGDIESLVLGPEVIDAITMGAPGSRVRRSAERTLMVLSAAHPIWSGDQVLGAVLVEESSQSILSLRNLALERVLVLTLLGVGLTVLVVFGFAQRLSARIRRLSMDAENAIDHRGHISAGVSGTQAGDEVGDLARSFSRLLDRLSRHQNYLENMASRLSHELRTPVAVVRSSLENLRIEPLPASAHNYMSRAEAGLSRLSRILSRMSEANRMEQALASTEPERYDMRAVVAECINGYRSAYTSRQLVASLPLEPVWISGAPDLLAQMLDKLVENAFDFALPDTPVEIDLEYVLGGVRLSVSNRGPLLPAEIEGRLFESMVSMRGRDAAGEPHLGLGLFVARLIADFHHATLHAGNLPSGDGVCFSLVFPLDNQDY